MKTFVLGLGAQKSGTSWLHDFLDADPTANFGPLKEYHVWDAVDLPEMAHFDMRSRNMFFDLFETYARRIAKRGPNVDRLRSQLQEHPENYLSFFLNILDGTGTSVTGDITPSYAGLSEARLASVKALLEARGITVKTVFIMRDPVERAVSAVQMNRRKRSDKEAVRLEVGIDEALLEYIRTPEARLRSDYVTTVGRIKSVFAEDNIYFGFFESMRTTREMCRLASFVGVSENSAMADVKVNMHKKTEFVSNATRIILRKELRSIYEFCASEFSESVELWKPQ